MIRSHIFAHTDQSGQAGISATSDLLAAAGLTPKLYGVVTTKAPGNAFSGILGDVQLFRGPELELAPLSHIYASEVPPDFGALPRSEALEAFSLQPGKSSLPVGDKGVPIESDDLTGRSAALKAAAPPLRLTVKLTGQGGLGHSSDRQREKKDKRSKDGKVKRRKREKS